MLLNEYLWEDVRKKALLVNPDLVAVIDKVNPSKNHTCFIFKIPYGTEILKRSLFYLPNTEGKLVSIRDSSIDPKVKKKLSYNVCSNPVTLVLKGALELFLKLSDRTIPLFSLIKAGQLIGTWHVLSKESMQPNFIWDMTSGARSLFLVPKIYEEGRHLRLQKAFGLSTSKPRTLLDHWYVFRELAQAPSFEDSWETEIICFSNTWFEHQGDPAWEGFYYYLLKKAWAGSEFWRYRSFWNLIFSLIQNGLTIRLSPYIIDTTRYLIEMGVGEGIGFSPAMDNQIAPIKGIQSAYENIYDLRGYPPTIMQPDALDWSLSGEQTIYYPLKFPITNVFGHKNRSRESLVSDLNEIRLLINLYLSQLNHDQYNIKDTSFYKLNDKVNYDYFHSSPVSYPNIQDSDILFNEDPRFLTSRLLNRKNYKTPLGEFSQGCIRIKKNGKK